MLGPYAIEWPPTDFRDEMLGRLGGVFRGTVMQFEPGSRLFRRRRVLAAARRRADRADGARGDRSRPNPTARTSASTQTGFEESERWRRYYEVIGYGWKRALAALKALLEK